MRETLATGRPMLPQLTVEDLLNDLEDLDQDLPVHLAGFGIGSAPVGLGRHRTHADGLVIHAGASELPWEVRRLRSALRRRLDPRNSAQFVATFHTPVWVQPARELQFKAVTAVNEVEGHALISHVNLAPVQGPSLQRLSDEEVRARLHEVAGTTPGALSEAAERYLIRMLPAERSKAKARTLEALRKIDELTEQIGRDVEAVARAEYLLGIVDEPDPVLLG